MWYDSPEVQSRTTTVVVDKDYTIQHESGGGLRVLTRGRGYQSRVGDSVMLALVHELKRARDLLQAVNNATGTGAKAGELGMALGNVAHYVDTLPKV